jgi:HD-GYP domain-containing protein (c-di-GMP phosphodiesterase class II)
LVNSSPSELQSPPFEETPRRLDAAGQLELLRTRLAEVGSNREIEPLVANVSEAVNKLVVEHAGMAEELLGVYEQLGIVFEVTRQLPDVHNEADVIDLFVDSLLRSYQERQVFFTHARSLAESRRHVAESPAAEGQRQETPEDGGSSRDEPGCDSWFEKLADRARSEGAVLVEHPPPGAMPNGIAEVVIGPVFAGDRAESEVGGSFVGAIVLARGPDAEVFRAGDVLLLEALTMFCGDLIRNHRLVRELRDLSIAVVRSLVSAVDQKDTYTSGHSVRVAYFADILGRAVELSGRELRMLRWSALLHDIGKIGIRDNVLKKEDSLTAEEFEHIKEHPVRSHQVVEGVPQLAGALLGVRHHHERYDGTGYPSRLAGEDIPLQARIVQVADVFDALTSARSYRPAYDWSKALDIMAEEAGRTIDPHLQSVFDRMIRQDLAGDSAGWERMVRRADRFAQVTEDDPQEADGA